MATPDHPTVYTTPADHISHPTNLPERRPHQTVLLTAPDHFDVSYEINPYMGGDVDPKTAANQWRVLQNVIAEYATPVAYSPATIWQSADDQDALTPPADLPDIVFCANHALPAPDDNRLLLSRMATSERTGEIEYFRRWAAANGYTPVSLDQSDLSFEGMGDAIWHPGRRLLWGGYGLRTDRRVYDEISRRFETPVIPLELTGERFYHLDLCFAPINETTVMICPAGLTDESIDRIETVFETVIRVPEDEATTRFACNCRSFDGETVVLETGNPKTVKTLHEHGFETREVTTAEFMKAGGSVCCLTLPLPHPQ